MPREDISEKEVFLPGRFCISALAYKESRKPSHGMQHSIIQI